MHCPKCLSTNIKKNGSTHYGRQNHKCKACDRQFVFPNHHNISESVKEQIRKALKMRKSFRSKSLCLTTSVNQRGNQTTVTTDQ